MGDIDVSNWNPRTVSILKKHGRLSEERLAAWKYLYERFGGRSTAELEYLRHVGFEILSDANQTRNQDSKKAIQLYRDAKEIFELSLNINPCFLSGVLPEAISGCKRSIRVLQKYG